MSIIQTLSSNNALLKNLTNKIDNLTPDEEPEVSGSPTPFEDPVITTMNISVDSDSSLGIQGYLLKEDKTIEYFNDTYPANTSTTVVYNIAPNSMITLVNAGDNWLYEFGCSITPVNNNYTPDWYQAGYEQCVVSAPLYGPGGDYVHPIAINVTCSCNDGSGWL